MTQFPDLFAALARPFESSEVKVRTQAGRQLHYVTARTCMNRLDDVLGPECWWDSYVAGENSVLCTLTIRLPDGTTLTKQDAGGYAGMADQGDDDKSGYSDAFKRACVKMGVSRYLYKDGVPTFVKERHATELPAHARDSEPDHGHAPAPRQDRQDPPQRSNGAGHYPQPNGHANGNGGGNGHQGKAPRTGRALFAWTKEMEQRYDVGLLKYLNSWSKLQEFPGRMVDWSEEQVALAHAEAERKLRSVAEPGGRDEAM